MTIYDNLFPLGLGTNRFDIKNSADVAGIHRAAELMVNALECGISYIDVAGTYSKGTAQTVCREAFKLTKANYKVTSKISALSRKKESHVPGAGNPGGEAEGSRCGAQDD